MSSLLIVQSRLIMLLRIHIHILPCFSFDVAIKQARSVDSDAQDELLMEAEKLARLRDHPNVVNIKVSN